MLVDRIVITYKLLESLKKIADKAYPNEACALLAGSIEVHGSSYTYRIIQIIEVENSDRSSISFSIRDEDLISAYEIMSRSNLELVGIFHTHPFSNAYPSGKDLRYMQINPVPWIILGEDGEMRAFIIDEGKGVKELMLSLSD
ncbi:MAG: M67 family metallopeptidase [Candidatus Nitrosocaldus sp.]